MANIGVFAYFIMMQNDLKHFGFLDNGYFLIFAKQNFKALAQWRRLDFIPEYKTQKYT